jgi:hypothetical protein
MKNTLCLWQCGRKTANRTRTCDACWRDRERIYFERKAREAAAEKRPVSEATRAALDQARARKADKLLKHLPATALS